MVVVRKGRDDGRSTMLASKYRRRRGVSFLSSRSSQSCCAVVPTPFFLCVRLRCRVCHLAGRRIRCPEMCVTDFSGHWGGCWDAFLKISINRCHFCYPFCLLDMFRFFCDSENIVARAISCWLCSRLLLSCRPLFDLYIVRLLCATVRRPPVAGGAAHYRKQMFLLTIAN